MPEINLGHIQFLLQDDKLGAQFVFAEKRWHFEKALNIHTTNFKTPITENLSIQTDVVFTHNS